MPEAALGKPLTHERKESYQAAEHTPREMAASSQPGPGMPATCVNLVLAIVNPLSGERSASQAVHDAFVAHLGQSRVMRLSVDTFRDPTELRAAIVQRVDAHAERFRKTAVAPGTGGVREPLAGGLRRKPTVLVAGGDGTVAFIMDQVQRAFAPQPAAAAPRDAADDVESLTLGSTGGAQRERLDSAFDDRLPDSSSAAAAQQHQQRPEERAPAVAVVPMGTGNDLSGTLGFGLGFTKNHLCAACICCPQDIIAILEATVETPIVKFDRWEAVVSRVVSNAVAGRAGGAELHRVGFNNYVSFGMDADVAHRFDVGRKAYPRMHHFRVMNKMWYGLHGISAAPFAPKFSNKNIALTVDGVTTPLSSSSNNCKAFVITNVMSYSGGVDLWRVNKPEAVELPRPAARGPGFEKRPVNLSPQAIGDGKLEIQTIGGLMHMTVLRSGFVGADKVGQGSTIDVVVADPEGTQRPVQLQADGEPLGEFTVPFRMQVHPSPAGPLYMHAAPASKAAVRSETATADY